jgi:hypothetical protein
MKNPLKPGSSPKTQSADGSRRSFFFKLGAGVSGALASAAGMARAGTGDADDLSQRVASLEAEKSLRKLHQAFEQAIDHGRYEEVVELFTEDAQVVFNGGIFDSRSQGVSRLFRERFHAGKTGGRMERAPGFELEDSQLEDSVELSADCLHAHARFPYSIQVGVPLDADSSLISMARLHGEGVRTWWEGGVYAVTYSRKTLNSSWRISRLEYRTLSRADYRPGRTHAAAIAVAAFSTLYPEDPHGPDALI